MTSFMADPLVEIPVSETEGEMLLPIFVKITLVRIVSQSFKTDPPTRMAGMDTPEKKK